MGGEDGVMACGHDHRLVVLSILVSILAAYASCHLADRLRDAHGRAWFAWLAVAALVDGIGIWSMHSQVSHASCFARPNRNSAIFIIEKSALYRIFLQRRGDWWPGRGLRDG